ncbi:MAG: beta-L-arabinofuranosidase domain-containing protein [Bryobacteraceae bacterium]|jgi:DUF1680 family protein
MQLNFLVQTTLAGLLVCLAAAGGDLTDRFHLTLDRVRKGGPPRYSEALVLADVVPEPTRRFTDYSGDVSGRYIGALALASQFAGAEPPSLAHLLTSIVKLQKPDGYFGRAFGADIGHDEMALLWGNGRLLIGMLEYYRLHPSPELLSSARRLGDFLLSIAPRMNSNELQRRVDQGDFAAAYICWTQTIEGLVELSRVTGERRYLDLAREIATRTQRIPAQHGHGFLTSIRGIVALYQATGEQRYLDQAIREWHGVIDSGNLLPQGAVPEAFAPKIRRTEGCTEADWLRLSLALWRITRNPEFLAQAELTLFNEYAMNQFSTGDYGSRVISYSGISTGADADGAGAARCWWCCTLHGLRAYRDIFDAVYRAEGGDLWYDLPVEGRGKAGRFAVEAESSLQARSAIRIRVTEADARQHSLSVRVPEWASSLAISVNGVNDRSSATASYRKLRRVWKSGDTVDLQYQMRTRGVPVPKTGRWAIFHGPWLLGADETVSPFFWDEPDANNRLRLAIAADSTVQLEPASIPGGRFAVPAARFRVSYLPEGYPMLPQKVVLRPIAEQTGSPSTAWYFLFKIEGKD